MKYNPQIHRRRSIRLKGYDYSQPGGYFFTMVVKNQECLFGKIADGKMILNNFGKIIEYHWQKLPDHFPNIKLDVFQIMPNHVHGIIIITDSNVGAMHSVNPNIDKTNNSGKNASPLQQDQPHGTQPGSLSAILQNYSSITSRKINHIQKTPGQKLWQRNFWEHIIRNEDELNETRQYIINNPSQWGSNT